MAILYKNNAASTLASSITNVATSLTVATGHGTRFPTIAGSDYFYVTIISASDPTVFEIVKCTARSGDVLTIVRAQESTTAAAWSANDRVEQRITAAMLSDALGERALVGGSNATGTWPISITGNAATVTNGLYKSGINAVPAAIQLNTTADNWMWHLQASSGNEWYWGPSTANFGIGANRLAISSSGSSPNSELVLERGTTRLLEVLQANLQYKGNVVLHAGNYNSYSPTLTGGGASGTWGIGITGTINGITINQERAANPRIYSATTGAMGLLGVNSAGSFMWQLYGEGSTYGLLGSAWGAWDIKKAVNGELDIRVSSTERRVLHAANYNSYSPTLTGTGASGTWGISITGSSASTTGNAATATTLQTARNINGTSFNGSANITTASWGTARTITIGSTGKSVDGSGNVSWTVAEIGALSSSGKAADADLLDGYNSTAFAGPVSTIKQFFWNDLSASGTQARTFEIARLGIDYNDWNTGTGPFEVELYEGYYSRGLKKKYVIHWGYTNTYGIQLVEYSGNGDNNFQVRVGTPVLVSGDNYYLPVFVDVKYYAYVDVVVTTNRDITASNPPAIGTTFINASPSATNIADFTADSTVNFASTTAVQINGNQLLHAANYNSYAPTLTGGGASGTWGISITGNAATATSATDSTKLPLAGGTLTGGLSGTTGSFSGAVTWGAGSSVMNAGNPRSLRIGYSGGNYGAAGYGIDFTTTSGTVNYAINDIVSWWEAYDGLIVKAAAGGTVGTAVSWTTVLDARRSNSNLTFKGNVVLASNNYTSYSPSLTGTGASGTWGISITGNAATATSATDSTKLPLSGGTLTGDLRFNNGGAGRIAFTDNYHGMILRGHPSDASGTINVTDVTSLVQHSGDFRFYRTNGSINEVYFQVNATAPYWRGNTILHAGNYTSYSPSLTGSGASGTWGINITGNISGYSAANLRGLYEQTTITFTVGGDANTYYPVIFTAGTIGFRRYSIWRYYWDAAPWDPIGTGSHKGGLTLAFSWAGDIAWGGNDKAWRIEEFHEEYTTMVAGMALPVTDGILVWLRGGTATYRFNGPAGANHGISVYIGNYTAANGTVYAPRTNTSNVSSEILSKYPIRRYGDGDMYVSNSTVLHAGNYSSYALPLSGGTVSGVTTFTSSNDAQITLSGGSTVWAGITWTDVNGTDYSWFYGSTGTWAFGGGGSAVSGKKMHIHGGVTIGSGYAGTGNPSNGLNVEGAIQQAGNQVLHAGNYANYTIPIGGGWYGSGLPGSRWYGYSVSGGEFVLGNGLPNAGQVGVLIDGCYVAGENNGFWSMASDNTWGSRRGMYWDGTYLNFTTNSATTRHSAVYSDGNVTAYSDERVKTNWRDFGADFIERLAQVKSGIYDRTDVESLTQVGVTAQSLRPVMEHAVVEAPTGELSVAYGNAALAAAVELAKEIVKLRMELDELKSKLN